MHGSIIRSASCWCVTKQSCHSFSSRRRHTRCLSDWSSDVCSSDLGTLTISWTSFEAIDRSAIEQQTITVTVVNGNLQVQLVPTTTATPAAFYTVVYNSDGLVQFQETWAVPSSVGPLRIRDVRIATTL